MKSLMSTSRLAHDNRVFVGYCPNSFFIKDHDTRKVLLQGRCVDRIYPLPSSSTSSIGRQDRGVAKSSLHLGHSCSVVVHRVLRGNNILFSGSNKEYVCDACQVTKIHQLLNQSNMGSITVK
jgi:histone deacetylase 1/2